MVAYPIAVVLLAASRPSAIGAFEAVKAYTPETARRPQGLKVRLKSVAKAVRKGLLVPVGDGRYYVDRRAVRRQDARLILGAAITLGLVTALIFLV